MNKGEKIWIPKMIESLEKEIWNLKKEIDRLNEYVQNLEMIDKHHQDMNGKLRLEINRLKGGM
jgi:predicted  nucleic acid-binding Zn-ribbon protein